MDHVLLTRSDCSKTHALLQGYANDLAGEYVRHFLTGELVVGAELEARLSVTLAKLITPEGIQRVSEVHRSNASCVIKVVQFPARTTEAEVRRRPSVTGPCERAWSCLLTRGLAWP